MTDVLKRVLPDDVPLPPAKKQQHEQQACAARPSEHPHYVTHLPDFTWHKVSGATSKQSLWCASKNTKDDASVLFCGKVFSARVTPQAMQEPDKFETTDKLAVTVRLSPSEGSSAAWQEDVQGGSDALQNAAHIALKNCFVPVLRDLQKKLDAAKDKAAKDDVLRSLNGMNAKVHAPCLLAALLVRALMLTRACVCSAQGLKNILEKIKHATSDDERAEALSLDLASTGMSEDGSLLNMSKRVYPTKDGDMPYTNEAVFRARYLDVPHQPFPYTDDTLRRDDDVLVLARATFRVVANRFMCGFEPCEIARVGPARARASTRTTLAAFTVEDDA